jgi:hypothetical protein
MSTSVWAVLVVHGVGDTGPGSTIDAFVPSLSELGNIHPTGCPEVRWLCESSRSDPGMLESFPAHFRRARVTSPREGEPSEAVFAEVYWADVSKVRKTFVDLVVSIVSMIFLLRFVTDQAANVPGRTALWLRFFLYLSGWILVGPIASLTTLMMLVVAVGFGLKSVLAPDSMLQGWLAPILCGVAFILGSVVLVMARTGRWDSSWIGFLLCFTAAACYTGIRAFEGDLAHALGICFKALIALYGILGVVSGIAFWIGGFAWCLKPRYRAGLAAGLALLSLQIGAWVLLGPAVALTVLKQLPAGAVQDITGHLVSVWRAFSIHLSFALALVFVALACQLIRWIWVRRNTGAGAGTDILKEHAGKPTKEIPRLLVNRFLVLALLGTLTVGYAGYWAVILRLHEAADRKTLDGFAGVLVPMAAIVLPLLLALTRDGLRSALHIVMDVVNHFYQPKEWVPLPSRARKKVKDAIRDFGVQQRIEARFRRVLRELLDDPRVTHLTVVAHSQGTVIAVDVLNEKDVREMLKSAKRTIDVQLVTMGSPLGHLYQHYFPVRYPPLPYPALCTPGVQLTPEQQEAVDGWEHLPHTVDGWLNVYRLDDFVGTYVVCVDANNSVVRANGGKAPWLVNQPVPAGGHVGYWRQRKVLEHVAGRLPG